MQLIIHSPSEDGFIKEITFNNEEIKQELALRLEKYQGLVYSDEEIKLAKSDRATLNKFKTALEDKRKEIKAQCLAPYEKFEFKIKEILTLVDGPMLEIDKQVKAFEEKQKQEKLEVIKGVYAETIGDLKDILTFEKIYNDKWMNTTYKLSMITPEIVNCVKKVQDDLKTLESLNSKFELQMKDKYLENLCLSEALATKTKLETQEAKLEEYKKAQEAKEEAAKQSKLVENPVKRIDIPSTAPSIEVEVLKGQVSVEDIHPEQTLSQVLVQEQVVTPELEMLEFRLWVTKEQKAFLRNWILENKIKCGKL